MLKIMITRVIFVFQASLEILLCLVANSPGKICALLIPVEQELNANQEMTGQVQTGQSVLALQAIEEIL